MAIRVARVLPDVSGLDRTFDYSIPDELGDRVAIGSIVRVDLHNRRVGGWVVGCSDQAIDEPSGDVAPVDLTRIALKPILLKPILLKPILRVTGLGPGADIIELAEWAAVRWAARRIRPFLVTASPNRAVTSPARSSRSPSVPAAPTSPATNAMLADGGGVLRLPPRADVMPTVLAAVAFASARSGTALVVAPSVSMVANLAIRLRRSGLSVAVLPDDWAAAAGGVDVVVGTRAASWGPCDGLAAGVVIDEHDEALQQERSPTWHARDVVVERCRRAGVPCVLVSPIPTLTAVETYAGGGGVVHPPAIREREGWPRVCVVDRTDEDPWKRSLLTSELIDRLRTPGLRVVCVSNITGRARVLACRSCRALIRCEQCDAAVGLDDVGRLGCRRCSLERPPVCQECGRSSFANLRPGVTRLREELEAAANRPVVAVTASSREPERIDIYVGTEAVLHRVGQVDVVAFLEFDSEMLAPRFRSAEQALSLVVRAARLATEVLIQTFVPDHEVIRAAVNGDPSLVTEGERARRQLLSLPPYGALARVSGEGSDEFVASLAGTGVDVGGGSGDYLVRGHDWMQLGDLLNATERPTGAHIRIEVDPPRV